MSWSCQFIGRPDAVKRALEKHAAQLTGQSKTEFDAARTHLVGLIDQCVGETLVIKLVASGHAQFEAGNKTFSTCACDLQQFSGFVT